MSDSESEINEEGLEEIHEELEVSEEVKKIVHAIEMPGYAARGMLISARLRAKHTQEDNEFVDYCNENLLDCINELQSKEDIIDVIPEFKKVSNMYIITNLVSVKRSLTEYKRKKCNYYSVPAKIKAINVNAFFSKICRLEDTVAKFTNQNVEQTMLWYSIHSVEAVWNWAIEQENNVQKLYWRFVLQYYQAKFVFETKNVIENIQEIGKPCVGDDVVISNDVIVDDEIRNNRAFCYVTCLGVYYIKNTYKLVFKIGKSDRQEIPYNERFKEHFEDVDYPDVTILRVIRCSNSTQLERIMKRKWATSHITWNSKREIYATANNMTMDDLVNGLNEYIINDSTRANKLLLEHQLSEKTDELQEKIEKIADMQNELNVQQELIQTLTEGNNKKDKEIARLKKLLAKK